MMKFCQMEWPKNHVTAFNAHILNQTNISRAKYDLELLLFNSIFDQ